MNKGLVCIVILISFVLYGSPAQEVEWGWKYKKPLKPQETFSHKVHENVLKRNGFTCVTCHLVGVEIEEKEEKNRIKISELALFPGKETCHFCHFNPKAGSIAPNKANLEALGNVMIERISQCSLCHSNVGDIQPANHNFDWKAKHSVYAKGDPSNCESCHSPKFCEDCHKRRDVLPTERFHDTNYIFVHPIDARADPSTCGQCHELHSFCDTCHTEGGYEK
jgi:hypothetical protein